MAAPSVFTAEYEQPTGDTRNARLALLPLRWASGTLTRRRNAPDVLNLEVSRATHHRLADFVSGREVRIKRDGAHWWAGFMQAPGLPGGTAGGVIAFRAQSAAAALLRFARGTVNAAFPAVVYGAGDGDAMIALALADADHGSGGADWFNGADVTLGSAAYAYDDYTVSGMSALEFINQMVANEGWEWRDGVAADGDLTFAAGPAGTGYADLTGQIRLFDGANCRIASFEQDDSRLTTSAIVAARAAAASTKLSSSHAAGSSTINVDSTENLFDNMLVDIGSGTTRERAQITNIIGPTSFSIAPGTLANAQPNDAPVDALANSYIHRSAVASSVAVAQAHHDHAEVIWNDQLARDETLRDRYAAAFIDAYDHVFVSATVEVTDTALIEAILAAGCRPGDRIALTSPDQDLATVYAGATVVVQEMTLEFKEGACAKVTFALGDPRLDDLALLERMSRPATAAATRAY
jgi:hypothetical protein